ncbi:hypothetical protein GDO81_000698 [Engystomops pustulosus]|uniref:Uncharacterized protein n=1 Tax=Engystomops pustulosus TaxID=76066 RepID=A0AAV7D7S1_ENGPU|nr:hypothetical protein GDO81_000698 [Engystomops pustulosus]
MGLYHCAVGHTPLNHPPRPPGRGNSLNSWLFVLISLPPLCLFGLTATSISTFLTDPMVCRCKFPHCGTNKGLSYYVPCTINIIYIFSEKPYSTVIYNKDFQYVAFQLLPTMLGSH